METRYFISDSAVVIPGRAVIVSERNADGALVGSYNGYYNPKKGIYTLYPRYNSCAWQLKKLVKHVVSEHLVRRDVGAQARREAT